MRVMEGKRVVLLLAMLVWMGHGLPENVSTSAGSTRSTRKDVGSNRSTNRLRHIKYSVANTEILSGRAFRLSEIGSRIALSPNMPTLEAQEHIINGNVVGNSGMFPQTVILALLTQNFFHTICTGTLVDENIVLTAAHCTIITPNANEQAGGEGLLVVCAGGTNFEAEREDYTCSSVEEGYIPGTYVNSEPFFGGDIALLRLSANLSAVEGVQVSKVSFDEMLHGTLVQMVGYGTDTHDGTRGGGVILRHVDGLIVDSDRCRTTALTNQGNDSDIVCVNANYDESGGSSCNGDSGGPVYVQGSTPEDNYLVAVISFGIGSSVKRCLTSYESGSQSLASPPHKEFLVEAMEWLGGTWHLIDDAPGLTCEGRLGLCEAIPGDASCLDDEGVELMTCCPTAKAQLSCTKVVAEECEDVELMEANDALLAKYEERCSPQYRCGENNLLDCTFPIPTSCSGGLPALDNDLLTPTVECCHAKERAETCLNLLLERTCEGSELVKNALDTLSNSFGALELCEEYECSTTRLENCAPADLTSFSCAAIFSGEIQTDFEVVPLICCIAAVENLDCLRSTLESCPTRQQLINRYLRDAEELVESGSCGAVPDCDPKSCVYEFNTWCDDNDVQYPISDYYNYNSLPSYPTGLLGVDDELRRSLFCCNTSHDSSLCLARQKERCGEEFEESITAAEEELAEFAPPEEECEAIKCDPRQCELAPFNPGYSAFNIPDNGCSELHVERRCLIKLLSNCEDTDNAIGNAIAATLEALEETECDPLECDIRAAQCYIESYVRRCPTPIAELVPGNTDTLGCCGGAVNALSCLEKVLEKCPAEPMVSFLAAVLETNAPFSDCQDIICSGSNCLLPLNDGSCQNASELEDPEERAACCDKVNQARSCANFSLFYTCVDPEADERLSIIEELNSKYTDDECREVSCADGINDCTAALAESCPDGYTNECCPLAELAKDCLASVRVACPDLPEMVEQIEAKMEEIESDILEPYCGPCYDLCGEWDCVLSKGDMPFCANCAGLLKPDGDGTDAACCAYDEEKMMCATVLKNMQPGICRNTDNLFYINKDGARTEAADIKYNYACMDVFAMRRFELACQVRVNKRGKPWCQFNDDSY